MSTEMQNKKSKSTWTITSNVNFKSYKNEELNRGRGPSLSSSIRT